MIELSKYIIQQTRDWIVEIYYTTDPWSFIFTTDLQQTCDWIVEIYYDRLTTDLWLNCRNILWQTYNRPVIELSKYIMTDLQQTCDWIVEIYYTTDLWLNCRNILYNRPVIVYFYNRLTTDLWLNCRNILCTRLVFVYFYNRLTTNLQQTYNRLWNRFVIELSKYIMTDLRQLWIFKLFIFRFKAWLKILRHSL